MEESYARTEPDRDGATGPSEYRFRRRDVRWSESGAPRRPDQRGRARRTARPEIAEPPNVGNERTELEKAALGSGAAFPIGAMDSIDFGVALPWNLESDQHNRGEDDDEWRG